MHLRGLLLNVGDGTAVVIAMIFAVCFSGGSALGKVPNITIGHESGASPAHAITVKAPNNEYAVDAASYWAMKRTPGYEYKSSKSISLPPKEIVRVELRGPRGNRKFVYFEVMDFTNDESNAVIQALNDITDKLARDKRKPTARNLNGVWSSGMDLVGITMQLNQKGDVVTGYGNQWGCAGTYGMFELRGTIRRGMLRMALKLWSVQEERRTYRISGSGDFVQLKRVGAKDRKELWPQVAYEGNRT